MDESYMIIALWGQNTKKRNTKKNGCGTTCRQSGFLKMNADMSIHFACVLLNKKSIRRSHRPVKRNKEKFTFPL